MPQYQAKSEEVRQALIENVITKYGTPDYMILDQRQCVHVFINELLIQDTKNHH